MLAELTFLIASCAPDVSPVTMKALVQHESRGNAYAIGVNSGSRLPNQPGSSDSAVSIANRLIEQGVDFDAGLGQINVRNWSWLGLTSETVFDPCVNLKAAQTVLADCYVRAEKRYADEQEALRAALSCYNTGNFKRGFSNGYVGHVLVQAGVKVPALKAPDDRSEKHVQPKPSRQGKDGFGQRKVTDGFRQQSLPATGQDHNVVPADNGSPLELIPAGVSLNVDFS